MENQTLNNSSSIVNFSLPRKWQKVNNADVDHKSFFLKTYPELNVAALYFDLDIQLVTWYQIKYLDTTSDGYISFSAAIKGLQKFFGYSKQTSYNLLNDGEKCFEVFYNPRGKKIIRIFGIKKVAANLTVKHLSYPSMIEVAKDMSRQTYRALLFDTYFKDQKYNQYKNIPPTSRQTLKDQTNVEIRTQQRYAQLAQTVVRPNFSTEIVEYISKRTIHRGPKQLPNSYVAHSEKYLVKGQIRKVNRALKVENIAVLYKSGGAKAKKQLKRYFDTAKSLLQNNKRNPTSYIRTLDLLSFSLWDRGE